MEFLRSIFAFLRGGAWGFSVLERAILDEAGRQLDADRADKLRRRIENINFVQRHDGGREVNAYSMRHRKPVQDETLRLSPEIDEQRLATFSFLAPDQRRLSGTIWLVNGQLFQIEFDDITEHIIDSIPEDLNLDICI